MHQGGGFTGDASHQWDSYSFRQQANDGDGMNRKRDASLLNKGRHRLEGHETTIWFLTGMLVTAAAVAIAWITMSGNWYQGNWEAERIQQGKAAEKASSSINENSFIRQSLEDLNQRVVVLADSVASLENRLIRTEAVISYIATSASGAQSRSSRPLPSEQGTRGKTSQLSPPGAGDEASQDGASARLDDWMLEEAIELERWQNPLASDGFPVFANSREAAIASAITRQGHRIGNQRETAFMDTRGAAGEERDTRELPSQANDQPSTGLKGQDPSVVVQILLPGDPAWDRAVKVEGGSDGGQLVRIDAARQVQSTSIQQRIPEQFPSSSISSQPLQVAHLPKQDSLPYIVEDSLQPGGSWVINLTSLHSKKAADRFMAKASSLSIPTELEAISLAGDTYWRVRVVGFSTAEEADRFAVQVREKLGLQEVWVTRR
jgi:hypothetical protein